MKNGKVASGGKRIILSGGGTMGSVSPLIAIYERIKKDYGDYQFLFVGGKVGPEKKAVESYNIPFKAIPSGKLRRYFSWKNISDFFRIIGGFFSSLVLIIKFKPDAIAIAGSFVGVPVAWAGFILRVPILIHQQDIIPGLANKLMANFAKKITISFEPSQKDFAPNKIVLTGNPVREEFYVCDYKKGREIFGLREKLPVVLILGGGTGAKNINLLVEKSLDSLLEFCQVIHITGKDKKIDVQRENYYQFEFLTNEMTEAICSADLVVTRSGMSTLSELIIAAKPTLIIPMADSHQEYNANFFRKNNAAIVLSENSLNENIFVDKIRELLFEKHTRDNLSRNIYKMMDLTGAENVSNELLSILKK